ncbi:hypothetical protein ACFX1R_033784 [Malus domestica]
MMERWTNYLFRSTLHRVMPAGQERYSVALFMSPNEDCVVECLKSCCSEESPPRFPPVRSGDYLEERFRLTHATQKVCLLQLQYMVMILLFGDKRLL